VATGGAWDDVTARAITALGVLIMLVVGVAAHQYTPFWFDPEEGCRLL
jgi:hypothetical protein